MIRSFFVPFRFQLLFSFASHLNCKVSSFKFLFGQFAICLDSISFKLIWNTLFQGVKLLVSNGVETNNEIAWLILLNDVIRVSGYLILFTMKRRWKNGSSPENSLLIGDTEEEWRGWKNCAYYRERILNCS